MYHHEKQIDIFLLRAECAPSHNTYIAENSPRKLEIFITVTSENFLHSLPYLKDSTCTCGYTTQVLCFVSLLYVSSSLC